MSIKTISVLGCGWLGLPLAEALVQQGYQVNGSTTTQEKLSVLQQKGIEPFLLSFPENCSKEVLAEFLASDVLVFNVPPSRSCSGTNSFEQFLQAVLQATPSSLKAIIFISSTSVYPDINREVREQDAVASLQATSLMLRCEALVKEVTQVPATIIRFGGLMGGTRHPGRFLAGKTQVPNPSAPVNMIHLADCIGLLHKIIQQEKFGYTFNACAPVHPSRKQFYTYAAQQLGLTPPIFVEQEELSYKQINSDYLQQELKYQFTYPDPLQCLSSPTF